MASVSMQRPDKNIAFTMASLAVLVCKLRMKLESEDQAKFTNIN